MRFIMIIILTVLAAIPAIADDLEGTQNKEWSKFQADPKTYVTSHTSRFDQAGQRVPDRRDSVFTNRDIRSRRYVELKANDRRILRRNQIGNGFGLVEEESNIKNKVTAFLDLKEFQSKGLKPVFRLDEIDALKLLKSELAEVPWSGSYWPIFQGTLAARYASQPFMGLPSDWKAYYDYTRKTTLSSILAGGAPSDIDALSPAEKYDLMIGLPGINPTTGDGFLAQNMWNEGRLYYERFGKVETWMGICHGWAPASFMVPRPRRAIVAKAVPEQVAQVKLYPADMKGLISLLWAKGSSETTFFGGRCNDKDAKTDPETGRLLAAECFDVNPAFWHLAVVNQLGLAKRSMVIDASFDYEVWNQPLRSYQFRYFNPQTGESRDSAAAAIVKREDYAKDKFRKFRSPNAAAYVGVQMEISYVSENWNFHAETDDATTDAYRSVTYLYDLELDANGDVIGGEWYRNEHPDFVWLPLMSTRAVSSGDRGIAPGGWNPLEQPVPPFWREIAIQTARYAGEPLAAIVEPLEEAAASGRR